MIKNLYIHKFSKINYVVIDATLINTKICGLKVQLNVTLTP